MGTDIGAYDWGFFSCFTFATTVLWIFLQTLKVIVRVKLWFSSNPADKMALTPSFIWLGGLTETKMKVSEISHANGHQLMIFKYKLDIQKSYK